jgi:hypothetical protein
VVCPIKVCWTPCCTTTPSQLLKGSKPSGVTTPYMYQAGLLEYWSPAISFGSSDPPAGTSGPLAVLRQWDCCRNSPLKTKWRCFSVQCSPISERRCFLEGSQVSAFVLLVTATCRWRWMWNIGTLWDNWTLKTKKVQSSWVMLKHFYMGRGGW